MQRSTLTILTQVLILFLISMGNHVFAHSIKQIVMDISIEEEKWSCSFLMDATFALPEFRGDQSPPKSREWLIQRPIKEIQRIQNEARNYIEENFQLTVDGKTSNYTFRFPSFETVPYYFPIQRDGLAYLSIILEGTYPTRKGKINVAWSAESGPGLLLRLIRNGEPGGLLSVGYEDKISLATLKGEGNIISAERAAYTIWAIDGFTALLPNGWSSLLVTASLVAFVFICLKNSLHLQISYFTTAFLLTVILGATGILSTQVLFAKILLFCSSCIIAYFIVAKKTWHTAVTPLFACTGASAAIFLIQNYLNYYQNTPNLLPMKLNHAFAFSIGGLFALLAISLIAFLSLAWCQSFVSQKASFSANLTHLTGGLIAFSAVAICFLDLFNLTK